MAYFATPLVKYGLTARPDLTVLLLVVPPVAMAILSVRHRYQYVAVVAIGALLFLSPGVTGVAAAMAGSLGRHHRRLVDVIAALFWFVGARTAGLALGPLAQPWDQTSTIEWITCTVTITTATLVGLLSRSQHTAEAERASAEVARHEAEQERVERARLAEREAIAREMHDVLAHRISLVALHAGVLAHRVDLDPQQTRDTALIIRDNAKSSLDELRMVLAALRDPAAASGELATVPPQPTLEALPVLVAELSDDHPVELSSGIELAEVPGHVSRQVFRMIQEALTNARKHAPGAPTSVRLTGRPGTDLDVMIRNQLAPLAIPDRTGSGLGLVGMAERAGSIGGEVEHSRTEAEFVVRIVVPWKADA